MTNTKLARLKNLGEVEQVVMDYVWTHGPSSSEECREALASLRPMKDSTIRTVLRRLEEKGYLTHETEGRTFIYKASDARQNVAVRAVKNIIDRFCGGSAEQLVLGMVDNAVLDRKQLERLARKIADSENSIPGKRSSSNKDGKRCTCLGCACLQQVSSSTRESGRTGSGVEWRCRSRTGCLSCEEHICAPFYLDGSSLRGAGFAFPRVVVATTLDFDASVLEDECVAACGCASFPNGQ